MGKRIRIAALVAITAGGLAAPAAAQTVDEVLEEHYEAIGGEAAWRSIQSMKATGTVSAMGGQITAPFTMMQKRPSKMRFEFNMQGMQMVQAYDGQVGWMQNPMMGSNQPQRLPGDMASQLAEQFDLDGALVGWKEAGHRVELVGRETVAGVDAYKLELTLKSGDVTYYYLDAQTYLPVRWSAVRDLQGTQGEFVTDLGDYRQVGDVMVPFSIEMESPLGPQSLTFQTIDVNVPLADALFAMPGGGTGGGR